MPAAPSYEINGEPVEPTFLAAYLTAETASEVTRQAVAQLEPGDWVILGGGGTVRRSYLPDLEEVPDFAVHLVVEGAYAAVKPLREALRDLSYVSRSDVERICALAPGESFDCWMGGDHADHMWSLRRADSHAAVDESRCAACGQATGEGYNWCAECISTAQYSHPSDRPMHKSELVDMLNAIPGDPEVIVMSGVSENADGEDADDYRAHRIRCVHVGWPREVDGDLISIEIIRNYDEDGQGV
jgi:hypothetical protein